MMGHLLRSKSAIWQRVILSTNQRSAPIVLPSIKKGSVSYPYVLDNSGGGAQNRTGDTRIFSPLLYRLSYPASRCFVYPDLLDLSIQNRPCQIPQIYRQCHVEGNALGFSCPERRLAYFRSTPLYKENSLAAPFYNHCWP
jgi:hypothetical protein